MSSSPLIVSPRRRWQQGTVDTSACFEAKEGDNLEQLFDSKEDADAEAPQQLEYVLAGPRSERSVTLAEPGKEHCDKVLKVKVSVPKGLLSSDIRVTQTVSKAASASPKKAPALLPISEEAEAAAEQKRRAEDAEAVRKLVNERFVANWFKSPSAYGMFRRSLPSYAQHAKEIKFDGNTSEPRRISTPIAGKEAIEESKKPGLRNENRLSTSAIAKNRKDGDYVVSMKKRFTSAVEFFENRDEPICARNIGRPSLPPPPKPKRWFATAKGNPDRIKRSTTSLELTVIVPEPKIADDQEEESSTQEYNEAAFLQDALGNDAALCTTDETIDLELTPGSRRSHIEEEPSVCTSDASELMSKTDTRSSSLYRSLTRKVKIISDSFRSLSRKPADIEAAEENDDDNSDASTVEYNVLQNGRGGQLLAEVRVQQEARMQASKAIDMCNTLKEFNASQEEIEAERQLLIATNRYQALLDEIRRLDTDNSNASLSENGTVTISDVALPFLDQRNSWNGDQFWVVFLFKSSTVVRATEPIALSHEAGQIRFPGAVTFENLNSDFTIELEVHLLRLRRSRRTLKYFSSKTKSRFLPCPKVSGEGNASPELHGRPKKHLVPAKYDSGLRDTAFRKYASLTIDRFDLQYPRKRIWYMQIAVVRSPLQGQIYFHLSSTAKLTTHCCSFLTICSETIVWNRRWCVLDGYRLKYWNYPYEQDSVHPIGELDLRNCTSPRVRQAGRELCARPRTLLVELARRKRLGDKESQALAITANSTLVKYFLSADTPGEMGLWEHEINAVLRTIRDWHVDARPGISS